MGRPADDPPGQHSWHFSREAAVRPGSPSEYAGVRSSWPWPWPGTAGAPRLQEGHGFTCWDCSRPSPPLPCQAAFDHQPALAPRPQRPAGLFFPLTFRPRAWLVESHGISTPLTGCATTLQTHFKFDYCYHYFWQSERM